MSTERASEAAILVSVSSTLRTVVMPALDGGTSDAGGADDAVRTSVVQLIGIVEHASKRLPDPGRRRLAELQAALDRLAANDIVVASGPGEPLAIASAALVASVGRSDIAADQVRAVLHPVLVEQLDEELASTMPLIDAFRGRLRDA